MSDSVDRQFDEADDAATQAVTAFVSEFESMWGRWEDVNPSYIVESVLLELCTEVSALTDDIKDVAGPTSLKLLNAMAVTGTRQWRTASVLSPPSL